MNLLKQQQLKELSILNGTMNDDIYCHNCGEKVRRAPAPLPSPSPRARDQLHRCAPPTACTPGTLGQYPPAAARSWRPTCRAAGAPHLGVPQAREVEAGRQPGYPGRGARRVRRRRQRVRCTPTSPFSLRLGAQGAAVPRARPLPTLG